MTEPIYFTIREQEYNTDESSKIAENFNTKISEMTYRVDLLKQYASDVIVEPFLQKWERNFIVALENSPEESFGRLNIEYIRDRIQEDSNNTIYFYTKNGTRVKKIQAFITYDIRFIDPWKKQDPFIYIHTFAINASIPLDQRKISGSNLFSWFYKNAMKNGFICIKIDAISSAINFWRNKSRFIYITDNMSEIKKKNLEALDQLFEQKKLFQNTTGKEAELRKITRDIMLTKNLVGEVPMKRTKSQNSPDSSANSDESPIEWNLHDKQADEDIQWHSPESYHSEAWYSPESIASSLSYDSTIVSPKKMIAQLDKQYPNSKRAKSTPRKRTQKTLKPTLRRTKSFHL
jgi:hypothetical protein